MHWKVVGRFAKGLLWRTSCPGAASACLAAIVPPTCRVFSRTTFSNTAVVIARIDQLGVPGFVLYIERGREQDLRRALETSGARSVSDDSVTAMRIEAGYPLFGVDMDDDIIPLEAGIESRAI